jgi:hypothetical protein
MSGRPKVLENIERLTSKYGMAYILEDEFVCLLLHLEPLGEEPIDNHDLIKTYQVLSEKVTEAGGWVFTTLHNKLGVLFEKNCNLDDLIQLGVSLLDRSKKKESYFTSLHSISLRSGECGLGLIKNGDRVQPYIHPDAARLKPFLTDEVPQLRRGVIAIDRQLVDQLPEEGRPELTRLAPYDVESLMADTDLFQIRLIKRI